MSITLFGPSIPLTIKQGDQKIMPTPKKTPGVHVGLADLALAWSQQRGVPLIEAQRIVATLVARQAETTEVRDVGVELADRARRISRRHGIALVDAQRLAFTTDEMEIA